MNDLDERIKKLEHDIRVNTFTKEDWLKRKEEYESILAEKPDYEYIICLDGFTHKIYTALREISEREEKEDYVSNIKSKEDVEARRIAFYKELEGKKEQQLKEYLDFRPYRIEQNTKEVKGFRLFVLFIVLVIAQVLFIKNNTGYYMGLYFYVGQVALLFVMIFFNKAVNKKVATKKVIKNDETYLSEKERIFSVFYRSNFGTEVHVVLATTESDKDIAVNSQLVLELTQDCFTEGTLLDIYEVPKYQFAKMNVVYKVHPVTYKYPEHSSLEWGERDKLHRRQRTLGEWAPYEDYVPQDSYYDDY